MIALRDTIEGAIEAFFFDIQSSIHYGDRHDLTDAIAKALGNASQGAVRIEMERRRQINAKGYDGAHDAQHSEGGLATAAACYALPHRFRRGSVPALWPWGASDWKPREGPAGRVRELEKAGALIAAEIDRLLAAGPGAMES